MTDNHSSEEATGPSIRDYVIDYRFELDGGRQYRPSEHELAMLEDAIEGYVAGLSRDHGASPSKSSDAADAARYRYLKERCSYYYSEGYDPPSPREFGIEWHWQDNTPARPDMDTLIDQEIEEQRALSAADEDEGSELSRPHSQTPESKG